jgi:hypothetical protein
MYPLRLYFKRPANVAFLSLSLALNLFTWGWLLFYIRPQEETLFLHYTVLFGVDFTGEWYQVFLVPLAGLAIFIMNMVLGWFLFERDAFAGYVLNAVSVFVQIILLATSVLLVLLNV